MDLYIFEVHFPASAVRRLLLNQSVGARPSYSVLRMLIQEKIPNNAFSLTWQDGKKDKHPCEAQTDLNLAIDDLAGRKTQLPTLASSSVVLFVSVLPLPSRSEPALEANSSSSTERANGLPHHGPSSPTPTSDPGTSGDQSGIKRKSTEISSSPEVVSSKSRPGCSRVLRPRSDAPAESTVSAKPVSSNLKLKPTASKPKSGGATYYTCAICSTNFFSSATLAKHSSTCMTPVIEGPQTMPPVASGYDVARPVPADDSVGPEGSELTAGPTLGGPLDYGFAPVRPDPTLEIESVHQDDDNSSCDLYIPPSRSTVYKAGSFAQECLECGLRFATGDTRTEHELAHHADRRFVCDECGSGFREEAVLAEHREQAHGRRTYRLRSHYEDNDGTLLPLPSRSNGTNDLPETGMEDNEQESSSADAETNEPSNDSAEVQISPGLSHQEDASAPSQPRVEEMIMLPDGVCAVRRGNRYRRLCRQAGCSRFPYKKGHCYPHFVLSTKGSRNNEPGQATCTEALSQTSADAPVVSPDKTPKLTPEKKERKRCGFFSCVNFSRRDGYCLTHYKKSQETQEDDVLCVGEVVIHPRPGPVPITSPKKPPPFAFPQLNDPSGKVVLNTVKGNYRCDVCGAAFEYNTHLGVHLLSHIGSVTLKRPALVAPVPSPPPPPPPPSTEAPSPSTGAPDPGQLQVVLKAGVHFVLLGGQFLCLFCGERFARNVDLVPHLLAHLRTPRLSSPAAKPGAGVVGPCSICGMVFTDNMIFLQHLEEHIRSPNPADLPALARKAPSLRKPSLKLAPAEFSGTPVRCHACERWFDGQGLLDRHFKAHPKHALAKAPVLSPQQILSKLPSTSASGTPSSSEASSGAAQATSVYQSVLPKAMVDPTFDCTQSDKKFTSPELLKKHGLAHKKPKPPGMTCLCKICHQIFPTVIDFRKHMEDNVHVNAEFRATPYIIRPPGSDSPVCGPVQLKDSKQKTPKEDDPDASPPPKLARVLSPKVLAIRRLKKRLLAIKSAKTLEPVDPSVQNTDPDSLVLESDPTDVLEEEDQLEEGRLYLEDVPAASSGSGYGLFESQKRPSQMVYNLATNWDLWKSSPRKMSNQDLAARIYGTLRPSGRDPYDFDGRLSDEEVPIEEYVHHEEEQEIECPITEVDVSSAMDTADDSHAVFHDCPVLWRFLRDLLDDTEEFPPCVTWVEEDNGRAKGVFRIPQRFTVAQKWSELNSENRKTGRVVVLDFDRDIRTSIDKSMLVLLDKKKNIFRFGVAASGWNRESQG